MFREREKGVLRFVAVERWRERGPGVLFGREEAGLLLDVWLPLDELSGELPSSLSSYLVDTCWRRLLEYELSPGALRGASRSRVPIVLCPPRSLRARPACQVIWS